MNSSLEHSRTARDRWCKRFYKLPPEIAGSGVLRSIDKVVWATLVHHLFYSDRTRGVFPSIEQLSEECGAKVDRVERSLWFLRYGHRRVNDDKAVAKWRPLISWTSDRHGDRSYEFHPPTRTIKRQLR